MGGFEPSGTADGMRTACCAPRARTSGRARAGLRNPARPAARILLKTPVGTPPAAPCLRTRADAGYTCGGTRYR